MTTTTEIADKIAASQSLTKAQSGDGGTIKIAASKKLAFAPAKAVKDALNG